MAVTVTETRELRVATCGDWVERIATHVGRTVDRAHRAALGEACTTRYEVKIIIDVVAPK